MSIAQTAIASDETAETGPATWLDRLSKCKAIGWWHGRTNFCVLLPVLLDNCGWQGDVLSLRDSLPASTHTLGLQGLLGVMAMLGFRVQGERMDSRDLKAEDLPGLFVFAQAQGWQRAVVVREMGAYGTVWLNGRETGRGTLPAGKGTFYQFERIAAADADTGGAAAATDEAVQGRPWLEALRARFMPLIWHAIALSMVMHLFTLAIPIFSMAVYDRIIAAHAPESLPLLGAGVVLALGAEHLIRWLRIRLAGWIGARSGLLVTAAMFNRLLFLPAATIEQASASAQLARIRAFESVRDFITGPVFLSMLEIPFLFVLILAIVWLAGPVAWISVSIVGLQIALVLGLRPRWRALGRDTAHAAALRQHQMIDMIENARLIYAAGLTGRMMQRFRAISWRAAKANHRFALHTAILQHAAAFVTVAAGVATIAWSLDRIWAGQMTGGAMVATMIITWRVLYPLQTLCAVMPQIEQIRGALIQVAQLMANQPEAHAAHVVLADHRIKGGIALQNLGVRYGRKTDPVFMGLSADIAPGEIVAIYGGNGSGKSSILRLLMGLYVPALGSIRFDGVDHRQFDPRCLRRQINYLPQTPELFPGTILDNLRLQDPLAEEPRLRQALLWADAWALMDRLPQGLDTRLGEHGFTQDSGLAARLALARLYMSERPLVLCDELSGQLLNSPTGLRFRGYLAEGRGRRTTLFVTHRTDWLDIADKVIWLRTDMRPVVVRPSDLHSAQS